MELEGEQQTHRGPFGGRSSKAMVALDTPDELELRGHSKQRGVWNQEHAVERAALWLAHAF